MPGGTTADYRRGRPDPGAPEAPRDGEAGAAVRGRWRPLRALRIAAGFLLLLFGVIGLFLPVLQGVLMILAGLAVLGRDVPWSRAITERLARFVRRRAARNEGSRPAAPPAEAP